MSLSKYLSEDVYGTDLSIKLYDKKGRQFNMPLELFVKMIIAELRDTLKELDSKAVKSIEIL